MINHNHLISSLLVILLTVTWIVDGADKYTNKYDNIDVDRILGNNRILTSYIKCVMDEGPCTPDGRELKKVLPDALATDCTKCNEKQKTMAEKVFRHLTQHRPRDWERMSKKFDPQGLYRKRYEDYTSTTTRKP